MREKCCFFKLGSNFINNLAALNTGRLIWHSCKYFIHHKHQNVPTLWSKSRFGAENSIFQGQKKKLNWKMSHCCHSGDSLIRRGTEN